MRVFSQFLSFRIVFLERYLINIKQNAEYWFLNNCHWLALICCINVILSIVLTLIDYYHTIQWINLHLCFLTYTLCWNTMYPIHALIYQSSLGRRLYKQWYTANITANAVVTRWKVHQILMRYRWKRFLFHDKNRKRTKNDMEFDRIKSESTAHNSVVRASQCAINFEYTNKIDSYMFLLLYWNCEPHQLKSSSQLTGGK